MELWRFTPDELHLIASLRVIPSIGNLILAYESKEGPLVCLLQLLLLEVVLQLPGHLPLVLQSHHPRHHRHRRSSLHWLRLRRWRRRRRSRLHRSRRLRQRWRSGQSRCLGRRRWWWRQRRSCWSPQRPLCFRAPDYCEGLVCMVRR